MTPILARRPRTDRAFERIYRHHVREVYRYALVVLHSPEDAEDVTQTTFLNAYRAFERGECPTSPKNWLISIAHGLCHQRSRQEARLHEFDLVQHAEEIIPDDETPTARDVRRALDHLAFDQRAALIMREVEGRSYEEIAEVLNVSTGAVETLIFRARRALREQLEGAFTCHEAERAISRRLDGELARAERRPLRAHMRECDDCFCFDRGQRIQRTAIRSLAKVQLPTSLVTFFDDIGPGLRSASKA